MSEALLYLGLDVLGAVGILQRVERLLELVARRRNICDHHLLGV